MKVTIIIPTFNVEKYISNCLDSVLSQTYLDIEIIVIDDVSSDQTVKMVNEYVIKEPRIKLLINEKNQGPSFTRNQGIKASTGNFIAFLDSDDWWSPDRLTKMIEAAKKYNADMICDDQYLIDDNTLTPWGTIFENGGIKIANPTPFSSADFINKNMGLKPIIKRDFILRHGILFEEELRYGEDYLLFLNCLIHGAKAFLLPEAYYYYRAREGSLVTNNMKLLNQTLYTTEKLLADPLYNSSTDVKEALVNRKKNIKEAIVYYKFMQPIKEGKWLVGINHLVKSPNVLLIFFKRTPKIFRNRIWRKLVKSGELHGK